MISCGHKQYPVVLIKSNGITILNSSSSYWKLVHELQLGLMFP
uniref:Uncharacterized protein n=1 Tax=Rhizophora mucronata TaxID=61149 RepID=A0A2P2IZS0_RHIMU